MENDNTGLINLLANNSIQILSFNCGKRVSQEQLSAGIVKIIKNESEVVYGDGFYCCPLKCKRCDE